MTDFDVLVIGGGTGNNVAAAAADAGLEAALVEPGPLGGTCLNRGCNPTKMLIQAANAANDVREAGKFHVDATLEGVDHLTSRDAIYRRDLPDSLVIMGGGYIAVELGYYFESMGSDVTIVEMMDSLVPREDGDVAAAFTDVASDRHEVHTGYRVTSVEKTAGSTAVHAESEAGDDLTVEGEEVLVALGRRPNTDTLDLDATAIETDDQGFIETNECLETTAENVWAQGDIAGNAMFKHSGDYETDHTVANAVHGERRAVDLSAMPHAIFTEPQIAGVGATEEELQEEGVEYVVGRADYPDSAMGRAKKLEEGFLKVLAAPDGEILGAHAIGYEASVLIHEAVLAMRAGLPVETVADTIHVHPTLSKVVESAFQDVVN